MNGWLREIGSALGRGVAWAVIWAPVAVAIGVLIVDPDNSMDEMSLPRLAVWGAAAGLLVGAFPFVIGTATSAVPLWLLASAVMGCITAMSAASAVGSGWVARSLRRRQLERA